MNFYMHHIGDWIKKTNHLTLMQTGAYRRLLDYCYAHETALPADVREVYAIAHATNGRDREAVRYVLERFFVLTEVGYMNERVDEEIAKVQARRPATDQAKAMRRARQARARNRRNALLKLAIDAGLTIPKNTGSGAVARLCAQNGVDVPIELWDATPSWQASPTPDNPDSSNTSPPSDVDTNPNKNTKEGEGSSSLGTAQKLGQVVRAVRKCGIVDLRPSDVRLARLVDEGVTLSQFEIAATEANSLHKSAVWMLAKLRSRLEQSQELMRHRAQQNGPGAAQSAEAAQHTPPRDQNDPEAFKRFGDSDEA